MSVSDFDTYQRDALTTAALDEGDLQKAILGLGLAGEAGEVADLLKKQIGHGHPLDLEKLRDELGDTLWYLAMIASVHGLSLASVAQANFEKLAKRYGPGGFSTAASVARVDVE